MDYIQTRIRNWIRIRIKVMWIYIPHPWLEDRSELWCPNMKSCSPNPHFFRLPVLGVKHIPTTGDYRYFTINLKSNVADPEKNSIKPFGSGSIRNTVFCTAVNGSRGTIDWKYTVQWTVCKILFFMKDHLGRRQFKPINRSACVVFKLTIG